MRVLVTGGAGFLGSHVVEWLVAQELEVTCYDLRESPFCRSISGDLLSLDDLLAATEGMDAVCHLGAVGDVYLALDKPSLAAAVNATGTANVLEACLRNGVRKVVYASTWEVYGQPAYEPLDEEHPCRPDHPYNVTKLAGEQLALSYDRLKDVPVVALRVGTAFGTRMRGNSVFSIFINKALAGEPITIQGTGEQARQFVHARDVAAAFYAALTSPVRAQVFNVVSPRSVSIRELAEMVAERIPTEVKFAPARAGDIHPARVSAQKAWEVLGWRATVGFEDGLCEIVEEKTREASERTMVR